MMYAIGITVGVINVAVGLYLFDGDRHKAGAFAVALGLIAGFGAAVAVTSNKMKS